MNKTIQRFVIFASFILVVAILRYAGDVLIPIALATLLAFLLSPIVIRLRRWRIPKVPAVIVTVSAAFTILAVIAWIVSVQLIDLAQKLPSYERNIWAKIESLQKADQPGPLSRVMEMIDNLRDEIEEQEKATREAEAAATGEPEEPPPVPVEVRPTPSSPWETVQRLVNPLLGPLGTAGIAIVLLVAMLLQREDLRDRFIKVVSSGRINVATQAVDDAARRVSRYLLMQLIVNATYGLPVGLGLYFIGIPNALLWGLLATVLRFIPFLGPWIAALFPVTLAAAVAPGWEPLLYTILLFVVMELVSNNIIEIWLYGAGTGISNLALLVAAVFWTWVWGPVGLFLSTPMTVCLLVIGKYVPGLRFLSMLLGSEPVLEPPAQFYQRMLAMDYEGMQERALAFVEKRSPAEFYDLVFIPALLQAEDDRHRGALAEVRQKFIVEASRELVEELERRDEEKEQPDKEQPETATCTGCRVLILSARDDADELVGHMLEHLLRQRGAEVHVAPVTASEQDGLNRIRQGEFNVAIVSAVPPSAVTSARRLSRLIRDECPGVRILVGIWSEQAQVSDLRVRLRQASPDGVATRVTEAVAVLQRLVNPPAGESRPPMPMAEKRDSTSEQRLETLNLHEVDPEVRFEVVARDLAQSFDVPVSLVSVVDLDLQFWQNRQGLPADLADKRESQEMEVPSLNGEDLLVIPDANTDPRFSGSGYLRERGIRFIACAALRRRNGQSVGTLCVVDTKPREITEDEASLLRRRAQEFMRVVERRPNATSPTT